MRTEASLKNLKLLAAKILCSSWMGEVIGATRGDRVTFHGCPLDLSGIELPPENRAALFWGMYESAEYRFVRDHLRPDLDVVELGSGIGAISSHIARRLEPGRRLVCVEANRQVLDVLRTNVEAQGGHLEVTILSGAASAAGLGSKESQVKFDVQGRLLGSKITTDDRGDDDASVVDVPRLSLRQIWAEHLQGPFQLVMDIEGAEVGLIDREAQTLKHCQQILMECHPATWNGRSYEIETVIEELTHTHGFRLADRYGPVCFFSK